MADNKTYLIAGKEIADIKEVTLSVMFEYINGKSKEDVDWLISLIEEEITTDKLDKDGNPVVRKRTFIEQRNAFVKKYFPELAPKGTSKKPSVTEDILAKLKAKRAQM